MRYVAKIHAIDLLTDIVVSGYIHGYDDTGGNEPTSEDFSYSIPGIGLGDPYEWLAKALYGCVLQLTQEPQNVRSGAPGDGGPHTISETGDMRQEGVD
jgi:hypothetical protein